MKLLIVTQSLDTEHPILGFFHRWVEEFAKHCEKVHVICLHEGKYNLPQNVVVNSLGKEEGKGRLVHLYRFYKLIWQLRKDYDSVFVHMNQIYIILGAIFWRALGKKVGLWYAHGSVTWSLHIATFLSDIVFTSTAEGMRIKTLKRAVVGQGIDIERFKKVSKEGSEKLRLVTVGRISQSKNINTLLKTTSLLKEKGVKFKFLIIGTSTTKAEDLYAEEMKKIVKNIGVEDCVEWVGSVRQDELPEYLQQSDIFIHDGSTNSLDKTLLEAVLCGNIVVSSNPSYRGLTKALAPSLLFPVHDADSLAQIIQNLGGSSSAMIEAQTKSVHSFIRHSFSVTKLISGIMNHYKKYE